MINHQLGNLKNVKIVQDKNKVYMFISNIKITYPYYLAREEVSMTGALKFRRSVTTNLHQSKNT